MSKTEESKDVGTMNESDRIYQIKITLDGISPPIWRRILVQADMTFTDFHEVVIGSLLELLGFDEDMI